MFKKRTRPETHKREVTEEPEQEEITAEEEEKLPLAELLELRKLRQTRLGIDSTKLGKGDAKKKRKRAPEEQDQPEGGLKKGAVDDEEDEEKEKESKARRAVRTNNFTQQTNALDVDKHMMEYIEENLKIRSKPREEIEKKPVDPQEALYNIPDRWKVEQKAAKEEGSVTSSLAMLTAIPEVDLGMDTRLKNIEETEKAKRVVAEERHERKRTNNDEEHLVASRFYRPNLKMKSDADIMRDAKLEAMGLSTQSDHPRRTQDKPQVATDEMVMERFKKRMRK
ncbi:hypothetical protein K435DRAFT_771786 [Dendrothele bispora CBS 962.96]|uniref:Hepatocellular carcinoma-associated antigen 59-domain-containing protein n=1 Tax=Dendrothele bispora (strain CBS 962.96) TaxID=1314807 RepID=A0A4S8MYN4_DENBC|nr:hypothetical protein K435DRAFT_771786 [Dendrothele bispora CBS 962.96]